MRMDKHTHTWVPVSFAGAPANSWEKAHAFSTGMQQTLWWCRGAAAEQHCETLHNVSDKVHKQQ